MLQQTVVAAVVPFFERFVARFADLPALAAASEDQVLAAWSGLGYYARARNLHRAACAVMDRHGGQIPSDEISLRALPGIGAYTAAAIAAIAFGRSTFALDGNAARVIARLQAVTAAIDRPETRNRLRDFGLAWVPARRPGDFVQAVMELGATVCLPRSPACDICPLASMCAAFQTGQTLRIPLKSARPQRRVVRIASVRMRRGGRVLLVRRKTGLLAGTWMLPSVVTVDGESAGAGARSAARDLGMMPARMTPVGTIRHLFTHRDVTAEVFDATVSSTRAGIARGRGDVSTHDASAPDLLWADELRLDGVAVSSFLRKQLALKRDKSSEPP